MSVSETVSFHVQKWDCFKLRLGGRNRHINIAVGSLGDIHQSLVFYSPKECVTFNLSPCHFSSLRLRSSSLSNSGQARLSQGHEAFTSCI